MSVMAGNLQRRKLYLHVGMQKTGSSYLQHMLRLNAKVLDGLGVAYLNYSEEIVSSGNGDALMKAAAGKGLPIPLEHYFGAHRTAIISSELLYSVGHDWVKTFQAMRDLDVEVVLIAFFRDPLAYLLSAYSQNVSRHGYQHDFETFVLQLPVDLYIEPIRTMVDAAVATGVKVSWKLKNYDAWGDGLFKEFLALCELDAQCFQTTGPRLNASLNADQLLVLRVYNSHFPQDISSSLSQYLQANDLFAGGRPQAATPRARDMVREKYSLALHWINLRLSDPPLDIAEVPSQAPVSTFSMGESELSKLMGFFASGVNITKTMETYIERMMRRSSEVHVDVLRRYPDFDPVHYLVCNPDLVIANVNPFQHFADHGAAEGRSYKLKLDPVGD
ncbi:hypothetical protein [Caenimonas aquaedulcis]|uniref:Sulfotransferase domain-containing protein n=1 Tax=Caenimonas aquaedulcis TaxID=2793270 RepID=A0A931H3Y9_9BURK|nr:hypothetical protein [Caenimonas aquaedulcis]MBG9388176.1 hypothetical protein [Caenimonas aquaedulcis]